MANSMLDSVLEMVTPEMKEALSAHLGESQLAIQAGLKTASAMTLTAIASKVNDTNSLSQFLNLVGDATHQHILESLNSLASVGLNGGAGEVVNRFLHLLFGAQRSQATNFVAQRLGLSQTTASGLLGMAAALVLGFFSKPHSADSLNLSTLSSMLKAEAPRLERQVPANFLTSEIAKASAASNLPTRDLGDDAGVSKVVRWFVSIATLGAILMSWMVYRSLNMANLRAQPVSEAAAQAAVSSANVVSESITSAAGVLGVLFKTKLPDGTELSIPKSGVENKLIQYLDDRSKGVDKDMWFDLDRLQFEPGKATLEPAPEEQLRNIAAILKAYPRVKTRIGGYADDTGNKAADLKLSEARAKNVMAELVRLGVDPSRISAKGFGGAKAAPVEDNATGQGRKKTAFIALQITQK